MTFLNLSLRSPVVRAAKTVTGELGVAGARFVMGGGPSEGRFSLVEHPIVPRGLAAPVHLHTREDEFSFVLEGRWGFMLGPTSSTRSPATSSSSPGTRGTRSERHRPAGAAPGDHLHGGVRAALRRARRALKTDPGKLEAAAVLGPKYGVESDPEATARIAGERGLIERPQ